MGDSTSQRKQRRYCWPKEARDLATANLGATGFQLRKLITALARQSGNPRHACWRFLRGNGLRGKSREYRRWSPQEQERLLRLMESQSTLQAASTLRRSEASVRAMLKRLGASCIVGKDWFTKYSLADALRVQPAKVQQWIDRGWLKTRVEKTGGVKRVTIDADEFCRFCHKHRTELIGRRLNADRLDFIQQFVFPASHAELLPVRQSKKERAAYEAQFSEGERKSAKFDDQEWDETEIMGASA